MTNLELAQSLVIQAELNFQISKRWLIIDPHYALEFSEAALTLGRCAESLCQQTVSNPQPIKASEDGRS